MKRISAWKAVFARIVGALVVLLCVVVFMPSAHADEARIDITANPTELPEDGPVTFTFEIANYNADYPMTDVTITYNGTIYNVMQGQQIPPSGSARDITLTLNVTQSQLGKPITFLVSWNRNGEPVSQEAQITIAQAENPVITVTRTANKTNARPGEQVVITYTIKNTTKFDMTDIMLIDENISDLPIFEDETLRASRTTSYDFTYTMGDESVTSTPLVTYTVNGKTKTFSALDPLELTMVLVQLDFEVQAGTPTPSGVSFAIDVRNTGTQEIGDITVTDERANLVNDTPFSLAPGEDTTLSYLVVPLMTEPLRNVQFKLSGTDPFGEAYTLEPDDVYEVYPYVDASQISVTVRAETVTPWTAESGKVSARIIITNHSSVELTDITVIETTIGVIKNYETLPAGETSFDQDVVLGSPRNLSITVKGYDPTGTNRELASCVMPVAYGTEATAEAEITPPPSGGGLSIFDGISSGITKILIALGVLMVFSFVILIVLTAMERSRAPRWNDDDDDDVEEYFQEPPQKKEHVPYQSAPDPEEISYTKRMLAMKDEAQAGTVNSEPFRLPPPASPAERPRAVTAPVPLRPQEPPREPKPRADEVADRLVQTAHSRYTEAESRASYRPASDAVKPYEPHPKQTAQVAAPRVFDYKKQPKRQPLQKKTVTRVQRSIKFDTDDEEY
ncbi:MAG: hypothetical protein GX417_01915 [Clostridiales bacterium]|nr:hypothetical protein [Clostridiales bacterium]